MGEEFSNMVETQFYYRARLTNRAVKDLKRVTGQEVCPNIYKIGFLPLVKEGDIVSFEGGRDKQKLFYRIYGKVSLIVFINRLRSRDGDVVKDLIIDKIMQGERYQSLDEINPLNPLYGEWIKAEEFGDVEVTDRLFKEFGSD